MTTLRYASLTANMQCELRDGVLYERDGHPEPVSRWRKVKDTTNQLSEDAERMDRQTAYRAKCLLSCLNGRTNIWGPMKPENVGTKKEGQ